MNKKIKVIELLNKIANGEEVPKKIKYKNELYVFNKNTETIDDLYRLNHEEGTDWLSHINISLMDIVEIIEEQPEIDEIGKMAGWALVSLEKGIEEQKENINFTLDFFGKKINEIITNQNKIAKAINKIKNK